MAVRGGQSGCTPAAEMEAHSQGGKGRRMPKNSKSSVNSRKGDSFELLDESYGDDSITAHAARRAELSATCKARQPYEGHDVSDSTNTSGY